MLMAADCRERATNCQRIAATVIDPTTRDDLLRVAAGWLRFADSMEHDFARGIYFLSHRRRSSGDISARRTTSAAPASICVAPPFCGPVGLRAALSLQPLDRPPDPARAHVRLAQRFLCLLERGLRPRVRRRPVHL
jgi:hypothetical protein